MNQYENPPVTPETSRLSGIRTKARDIGAVTTASLALFGSSEAVKAAPHRTLDPPLLETLYKGGVPEAEKFRLKKIEELPGYGIKVSPETRKQLTRSTVKIAKWAGGFNDVGGEWREHCTGVKVKINDQYYISTAKHCFAGADSENFKSAEELRNGPVVEIAARLFTKYAVLAPKPKAQYGPRDLSVSAAIQGVAVKPGSPSDVVLLKPGHSKEVEDPQVFDQVQYIDALNMKKVPKRGQEMAVYGMPAAADHQPVAAKGIYLGRMINLYNAYEYVDIVGIKAKDQLHDSCLYGASGSSAVADGFLSGPLAFRNNVSYKNNAPRHPYDVLLGTHMFDRDIIDAFLEVDTSSFNTLCGYSVYDSRSWSQLAEGMSNSVTTEHQTN